MRALVPGRSLASAAAHARAHADALADALAQCGGSLETVVAWGERLAQEAKAGRRLLVAGNGGSAAQAQHLTAELVGRYHTDRPPMSAVALHLDSSSTTAIVNDFGADELFARQTDAHGRPGDVLLLLSTSGRSPNLLSAARRASASGLTVWAMTGPAPNPLAALAEDAVTVEAAATATVQEIHLVFVHLLCTGYDLALGLQVPHTPRTAGAAPGGTPLRVLQ